MFIDRCFLPGGWTSELCGAGGLIHRRSTPTRNQRSFTKEDSPIDQKAGRVTCPAGEVRPIRGPVVRFPSSTSEAGALRPRPTGASPERGQTPTIHAQEGFRQHLRWHGGRRKGGRSCASVFPSSTPLPPTATARGLRARNIGLEESVFDLCRCAFMEDFSAIDRIGRAA